MRLKQIALKTLETTLNKFVSLDKSIMERLSQLDNKKILINISNLSLLVLIKYTDSKIILDLGSADVEYNPDVKVSGTSGKFIEALLDNKSKGVEKYKGISISGDLGTAQLLQEIVGSINIDWEEELAKIAGDIPARQIGNFVRNTRKKAKNVSMELIDMTEEYIKFEKNLVANKNEVENFISDVDELRDTYDRLSARISNLN